ncbi:MAG TPA: polyphosphate kinase 2 family protein [Propylenella sp.]
MPFPDNLIVRPGSEPRLAARDPRSTLHYPNKAEAEAATRKNSEEISRLQDILYAEHERALLVVLQGTDSAGKDGTIRDVFNATGPIGISVTAFRQPSELEREHDFLWRVHQAVPRRGMIGIFNRSHYEDVLVVKVKGLAAADAIEKRYEQINAFERHLVENGTTVLKFMLHISKEEQRERLQARLDEPRKRWKFNPSDLEDRILWDDFQAAYETMLARCSTDWAPWHVIPADRKWVRSAAVADIVRARLEKMDPKYPVPDWEPKDFTVE